MKTIAFATLLSATFALGAFAPASAAVPCEDMLKQMRDAKASTKLNDADFKRVNDLESKAVERCNADDDTRSDKFLAEAMKIMGK